ncbi:MAG: DUF1553 domain-containing protein [Akkermansiaceae bacterium]|nr:DUF1553 domain-containing protein [Akkermansiaceae bacterium]MCP5549303.1 DUF1553 domain-containing protein [Akkermansiaceae bacterium]
MKRPFLPALPHLTFLGPVAALTLLAPAASRAADGDPAVEPAKPKPEEEAPAAQAVAYGEALRGLLPVAYWSFDQKGADLGETDGSVAYGQEGPTAKDFKTFPEGNRAAAFSAKEGKAAGFIRVEDPGPGSQFDFDNGDPITIEAWVNPSAEVPKGANMYILGKGRTGNPGVDGNNQNYGLRLFLSGSSLNLSWLFRSRAEGDQPGDWHRWDSTAGITPGSGWHHVAVTYVFGEPDSMRGYIDGEPVDGVWSTAYAGKTERAPVVDDDEIWVGTSGGKNANMTFQGLLDEVALYRRALTEDQLADRYPVAPYVPKSPAGLEAGRVRVEVVENLGKAGKWPRKFPEPALSYDEEVFGFFQVPRKYGGSGVREDWSNPFLLRASAMVTLPEGEQHLLLRTRGKGRLWLDGQVIAETEYGNYSGGGHNEVHEDAKVEAGHLRYLGPGDRETLVTVTGGGGPRLLVLEMLAGNGKVRATLGETTLSLRGADGGYALLSPAGRDYPLTDAGWLAYRRDRAEKLDRIDTENRLAVREKENAYWEKRHATARETLPARPADAKGGIDALLEVSWAQANAEVEKAAGGIDFGSQIKPILAENCFRCHEQKAKGGLRLHTREAALKGGDSQVAAIAPGKPEESLLLELIHPDAADDIMPPKGDPLTAEQRDLIAAWIGEGASYSEGRKIEPAAPTGDLEFLRRVTLDTVGVVPSAEEIETFLADPAESRRSRAIDRLLADHRWADRWTSYWQDVLAENPNILKPTLNNSGPFRFWIHEALEDNLPMDRFVTELVMMEGSQNNGGPAGFAMAAQNDVPMAAKAHILGTAFLGVEMKCARCHDAPYHESKQRDLFELAAMLNRDQITLPKTSSVPMTTFSGRKPLIEITLNPGETVTPEWPAPFAEKFVGAVDESLLRDPKDSRERLAALITAPGNERFPRVVANRYWKELMGEGIVETVDDWEASQPTHPELLDYLARELVASGYDAKHVVRLILNSKAYQRKSRPLEPGVTPDFSAPVQRRMTAEQVVDSLFSSVGKQLDSEELTMDNDGTQVEKAMTSLGFPRRAWEFTSLSNERDRPSLAIPKAQVIVDVLENFGWRASRQEPKSLRETDPNVRQPAILANGSLGRWVTTLSEDSGITALAARPDIGQDELVDQVFLRLLTRKPTDEERVMYAELLSEGFGDRIVPESERPPVTELPPLKHVAWSNHLSAEANTIKIEQERRAREGDPPTVALRAGWRERMEDMLWALMNSPEFVYMP